jgi:hypothetical protein
VGCAASKTYTKLIDALIDSAALQLTFLLVGCMPGNIQSITTLCVNWKMNSSTTVSAPFASLPTACALQKSSRGAVLVVLPAGL